MKTAEDFRKSLGHADEGFAHCVRQTLTQLETEEDKPVKKKISLSLAIAMAVMLLTVTALAASQWGVLDFAQRQGTNLTENDLLTLSPQEETTDSDLLDISIQEAVYQEGKLYLAIICQPKRESTLAILQPEEEEQNNIAALTMNSAMNTDAYAENLTVLDYAKSEGYQRVVTVDVGKSMLYVYSDGASGIEDRQRDLYSGFKVVELDHLGSGTLRMLVQVNYRPNEFIRYPERTEYICMSSINNEYLVEKDGEPSWAEREFTNIESSFRLFTSEKTRTSIPEDAHDIEGYRGAVKYVSVTPYDEGYTTISVMLDETDIKQGELWMSRIRMQILDEAGNVLCDTLETAVDSIYQTPRETTPSGKLHLATFPTESVPTDGTFTLRLQNPNNPAYVYDVYTYTMK